MGIKNAHLHTIIMCGRFISVLTDVFIDNFGRVCYYKVEVNDMNNIIGAIENTIPISLFNRGLAGKIFAEVKQGSAKVVMKNNAAECVLMAPDEYVRLMNEVNDARLLSSAVQRMSHFDPASTISIEEIDRKYGITPEMLENADEVEFE